MQKPIVLPFRDWTPQIHEEAFVAPLCAITGDVVIEKGASIWFGSVLRGDDGRITVGENTNVQDGCILHEGAKLGKNITVGHGAVIHKATVKDGSLIGARAVVWDDAVVGEGAMVAVGAVLPPRLVVPPGTLVRGVPAKVVRELTEQEKQMLQISAALYKELAMQYKKTIQNLGG